jgi:hypothetical protein
MVVRLKLAKLEEPEVDVWEYQSRLGALMYAILGTHPELAFAITIQSQHSTTPGKAHLAALNRVFHYLQKVSNMKLTFGGSCTPLTLTGYVNADWANNINDHCSVGGYVLPLARGAVSWSAQKQKIMAQSSTEAEYVARALTTNEAIWIHRLLSEIEQTQLNATNLLTDNQASISLTRNPIFHKAMKHIEVRYHHMHYSFESGIISPVYVPTNEQVADILTKPLLKEKHEKFVRAIGLVWSQALYQSEWAC